MKHIDRIRAVRQSKRAYYTERRRIWRAQNRGKANAASRKHYHSHREECLSRNKKWRNENPEKYKAWVFANRERRNANERKRRLANPEKARAIALKSRIKNRARVLTRLREWKQKNNIRATLLQQRRRCKQLRATGSCTYDQWMQRVEFYGWKCFYCASRLTRKTLTMDHRIPLSRNGSNWPANLVPACRFCNTSKGAKMPKKRTP